MIENGRGSVMHCLRRLAESEQARQLRDGQLLARYVHERDEWAFAALVRRHGPMVLGVCRRLLRNPDDADDAFQATFLVLVRKAARISKRQSVGSWLYKVAYRVSLRAREAATKRQLLEREAAWPMMYEGHNGEVWWELRPLLDDELARLPEKYGTALVLCYLEGKTKEQAARLLGCPAGTISSRLARGKEILRMRLARRGVVVSTAALATAMAEGTASASASLIESTVRAALTVSSGKTAAAGVVSAAVAALSEGMVRTMFLAKVKIVIVALVAVGAAGSGFGWVARQARAQDAKATQQEGRELALHNPATNDSSDKAEPCVEVVVTKDSLPAFGDLSSASFVVRRVPESLAKGWVKLEELNKLVNDDRKLKVSLGKDKPVSYDDIYEPRRDNLRGKLALGEVAVTVALDNSTRASGPITPGSRIDIEATKIVQANGGPKLETQIILRDIDVLVTNAKVADGPRLLKPADNITLRMAREQAMLLETYRQDQNAGTASIQLIVRLSEAAPKEVSDPGPGRLDELVKSLLQAKRSNVQCVESIYLAALGRLPIDSERKSALSYLSNEGRESIGYFVWILTNSKEFSAHVEDLNKRTKPQAH